MALDPLGATGDEATHLRRRPTGRRAGCGKMDPMDQQQQPQPTHTPQSADASSDPPPSESTDTRVVVITPDGMGVSEPASSTGGSTQASSGTRHRTEAEGGNPADLVEQPAKVMRIGSMIKNLLDEVRSSPLDEPGRRRLAEIHRRSIEELKDGLAPELVDELDRIALPFDQPTPSDAELRIAQAQLVGWLEGLFHGIQTALVAAQMAQQQGISGGGQRRALPAGHPAAQQPTGSMPGGSPTQSLGEDAAGPTGQYL